MKSRSKTLLDKAIAATISAVEIYNKPDFRYRGETFAILAINGWELLVKAKWLHENNNKIRVLYVKEKRQKKDGSRSKTLRIKRSRSGNPITYGLEYLAKKLVEQKHLEQNAWANIQALMELRHSSAHFYNPSPDFAIRLQEIGAASLKNFATLVVEWFDRDLGEYNFYLMPLAFIDLPSQTTALVLNKEEQNFLNYLEFLAGAEDISDSKYSVRIDIDVKLTRSKEKDAPGVRTTSNPDALEVRMKEEDIREQYPLNYDDLNARCKNRYSDFKVNQKYHKLRQPLYVNRQFCYKHHSDLGNSDSDYRVFYKEDILSELDRHYSKKEQPNS